KDQGSSKSKELCSLCADICEACGNECAKHKHMEHCQECAAACKACAEECRKMAA
ncbi:MAG: four-helix bundle copper-binding protein, partial [Sphingobacteriales bacterium]